MSLIAVRLTNACVLIGLIIQCHEVIMIAKTVEKLIEAKNEERLCFKDVMSDVNPNWQKSLFCLCSFYGKKIKRKRFLFSKKIYSRTDAKRKGI